MGTRKSRAANSAGRALKLPLVSATFGRKRISWMIASSVAIGRSSTWNANATRESGSRSDGSGVAWKRMPAFRARSPSSPRRPPMNRSSTVASAASASATASSGLTWPAVPPPTSRTLHRRAVVRAPDRLPSNVQQDTDGHESDADRRPAVRDERERDAGVRDQCRDDRHVHPRLEHEPYGDPGREERALGIHRRQRDPEAL